MSSILLPVALMLLIAILLTGMITGLSFILGPYNPSAEKSAPYECGIQEIAPPARRFPVKFLLVAMLFLIFDIEAVSFYPWAIILRQLRVFGLGEMFVFIGILLVGYLYIWKKGGFQWE